MKGVSTKFLLGVIIIVIGLLVLLAVSGHVFDVDVFNIFPVSGVR